MIKTAHFRGANINGFKGEAMGKYLSMIQVSKMLGISRGSIYKYLAERKLEAKIDELGDRVVFKFEEDAVERFKELLKKKWKKGQRLV